MQKLRVAIVGFGFMGRMHYRCWNQVSGSRVVALCDSNPNIVADTAQAIGNIEGAAETVDFDQLNVYADFDKMLADEQIDVVSITLPTFMHPEFTEKALVGKCHVLCEKPMALDVAGCERMIAAAEKSGKQLLIGHCVRFWPEYAKAKEIVDSGEYGKLMAASFRRLGTAPTWGAQDWFADEQRSGGMALDLHIHDTDYVQYLLGMPNAVSSFAARLPNGSIPHIVTQYLFDEDIVVTAEGGWVMTPSFGFEMSFNLVLEKASILYDCTRDPAFKVCPESGDAFTPEVSPGDGYSQQIEYFARQLNGDKLPEVTTPRQSCDSIRIIESEIQSAQSGQKVILK
ncbi:MAG: Gfo/Idh/MocA family oxidoreductase [Planctomycetes bacterium]|nr:Gfo/Idh/MocA family oxidoreductase [Planctomycetota bacterium]